MGEQPDREPDPAAVIGCPYVAAPKVAEPNPVGLTLEESPWGRAERSHIVCLGPDLGALLMQSVVRCCEG
jgi:hypothetical protein